MTKYHIRFRIAGVLICWTRQNRTMENCLKLAKAEARKLYGDEWHGGIAICGPQGDSGVYNF